MRPTSSRHGPFKLGYTCATMA